MTRKLLPLVITLLARPLKTASYRILHGFNALHTRRDTYGASDAFEVDFSNGRPQTWSGGSYTCTLFYIRIESFIVVEVNGA